MKNVLAVYLLLLLIPTINAQKDTTLISFGLQLGRIKPFGKSIIGSKENPDQGKPQIGPMIDAFISYHLNEKTRVTGSLMAQGYYNAGMYNYLDTLIRDHTLRPTRRNTMASFSIGLHKCYFLNNRKDYSFFINPNIGVEQNTSIFDNLYYKNDTLPNSTFGPVISSKFDNHYSPFFNLASGIELNFTRHFNFTIRTNYMVSNFGTEDVVLDENSLGIKQLIPDVKIGWVHRFSWNFGLSMNLFKRKK